MSSLRVAYYGDDFTGSVDVLLQFARAGRSGRLFTGIPDAATLALAADEVDVIGIAGIARSLDTDSLDAEVAPAFAALATLGADVVQYKACSTADSAPHIGSIGRVIEIARGTFGERVVPMLFAQPDFGRYTVFGHHYAAEGGTVHRLDRQPTMSTHPSTPMNESDLAVHVGRQTTLPIGSIPFTAYDDLPQALATATDAAVLLDAVDDAHLSSVGAAVLDLPAPVFVVGSGGLSRAIALARPTDAAPLPTSTTTPGPVLVVSGSRSPASRRQVEAARAAGWHVEPLTFDPAERTKAVVAALASGQSVVLTSDDAVPPEGRPMLDAIAEAAAAVIRASADATQRVIVAGGDTSSRITRLLGIESLSIAANPWGNVVLLRAHAADPRIDGMELLLKGGQVGSDSLFVDVLHLAR